MPTQRILPLASLLAVLLAGPVLGAPRLDGYLPADADYDPSIPKPSEVLGWEVGTWHVRHDLLVAYLRTLAERSDRVRIEITGKTHEDRPLLLLTISSPENLARIDEIRQEHLHLAEPTPPDTAAVDTSSMPVVVYLGYSIHGNEASGSNASLLVAYHLAAARGGEVETWLDDTVVLLDPSLNPDGLSRFAQWANMHRGQVLMADPNHREHTEGWPAGRTNHYWFDLNRDWLPLVHPESRARIRSFHRWKPNVLIDAHEMGTDQTYFFQPGIPIRQNPLTPSKNLELTREIARYHADALDAIGSLYFTEEIFDDFYYGKGSTYPDIHGTIGILFEQGSARGHVQESIHGDVTFPFAIRNHVTTSLSTLRAAHDKRRELLDYQAEFFRTVAKMSAEDSLKAYVFGDPHDTVRTYRLLELLRRHQVEVYELARAVDGGEVRFEPGRAYVVPLAQPQYRLIRAFFETRVDFADSSFYDVSTWTVPLAYGLPYQELTGAKGGYSDDLLGDAVSEPQAPRGRFVAHEGRTVAYAFSWDSYFAPRSLFRLLDAEVRCRVATEPFQAVTPEGPLDFGYGTIVVPLGIQDVERAEIERLLREATERDGVDVWAVTTGLTPEGIDVGSPSLRALERPKAALLAGGRVSTYEAGELWHLLDRRFEIPVTLLEADRLPRVDLDEYTHLVVPAGGYGPAPEEMVEELRRWVRRGGVVIATKSGAVWVEENLRQSGDEAKEAPPAAPPAGNGKKDDEEPERLPYAEQRDRRQAEVISGAIFEVDVDVTHPIAYGLRRRSLPVFRDSTIFLEPEKNPYVTVARYSDAPLLSGYVSADNLEKLRGTPAVVANKMGRGTIVRLVDNPNFRGFWYGTNKFFLNALFFGPIVDEVRGRR